QLVGVPRLDVHELQTGATSLQVASELGIDRNRWTIGYQCRFDKGREWLSPYTRDVLTRWAETGVGRVFFSTVEGRGKLKMMRIWNIYCFLCWYEVFFG
ncbi:ferrochelatase, partial [Eggerthella lenta]|uniref:ferrochelatase n=1 Tax=Eggerthella lenta TaxID=84112 RepID=UPI00210ED401